MLNCDLTSVWYFKFFKINIKNEQRLTCNFKQTASKNKSPKFVSLWSQFNALETRTEWIMNGKYSVFISCKERHFAKNVNSEF